MFKDDKKKFTIIVPIFNEEKSLSGLYKNIVSINKEFDKKLTIILVNDGSTDNTPKKLKLFSIFKNVKIINTFSSEHTHLYRYEISTHILRSICAHKSFP